MAGDRRGEDEIRGELAAEREELTTDLGAVFGTTRSRRAIGGLVALAAAIPLVSALLRRRRGA